MLRQRLRETLDQFGQIRAILIGCSKARDQAPPHALASGEAFGPVDIGYWRAFDHCGGVVRAYATFERFIVSAVDEWARWSTSFQPKTFLRSESVRALYETGFGEILRRRTTTRFADVDRARLGEGVALLYADPIPVDASLPLDPFFAAQPNLSLKHVVDLFSAVGLGDPSNWIRECEPIQTLCADEGFSVDAELRQLVERRNEAAHGNGLPAEILGTNEMVVRLDLLSRLCACLCDYVLAAICRSELGSSYERGSLGQVTRIWNRVAAFELTVTGSTIYIGRPVVLIGRSTVFVSAVQSIQVEGVETLGFSGGGGTAIGIKMAEMPSQGMVMIDALSVRGLPGLMGFAA